MIDKETTSDPAAPAGGEPAAPPAPEYRPTHVLSSDPIEPEPSAESAEPKDAEPAQPEKSAEDKQRESNTRKWAALTAQRYAEKARADQAERDRAALEERLRRLENPGQAEPQQMQPQDLDRLVDQRAAQVLEQREAAAKVEKWDKAGADEYGLEDFRERCKTLAQLATDDQRKRLLEVVTDMDDGHRAVAVLAEDAEEAQRVLGMPPHKMALALAKLASSGQKAAPAPVRLSRAPEPISPPSGGRPRGDPNPNGSMDEYMRWSGKQRWQRN